MELRRPFGIAELLDARTARGIFDRCNERLAEPGFSAQGLLRQFRVAVVCTTDDPIDSLAHHAALAARVDPETRVYPTFRPDRVLATGDPQAWNAWVDRLGEAAALSIGTFASLLEALESRHAFFHAAGCRASDHGLEQIDAEPWTDEEAAKAFDRLRRGETLAAGEARALPIGPRSIGSRSSTTPAAGCSSSTSARSATTTRACAAPSAPTAGSTRSATSRRPGRWRASSTAWTARTSSPRPILYNLNPADNEVFATMIGNFQDGSVPGKIQYGPAWWFLDQLDGMEAQMRALSSMGLFSRFVGMVTDSRSFLSYPRHDYFRRLVCNLLGHDVRRGLVPDDMAMLGRLVEAVSFFNAREYLGLELGTLGRGLEPAA